MKNEYKVIVQERGNFSSGGFKEWAKTYETTNSELWDEESGGAHGATLDDLLAKVSGHFLGIELRAATTEKARNESEVAA